ncbi:unnamed protein product [Lactuca saligna]|uniref:MULE transposase domain-containing protein n=1 Tax=Lactuca saligna TaxID=75948 RepID=A0AA35ZN50_LACSI|nr:unnamed protein product [Lactuca saligna]
MFSTLKTIYNERLKLHSSTVVEYMEGISTRFDNRCNIQDQQIWYAFCSDCWPTSTNKTFSIAFAFIVNEKEENYNWVLTCLKSTLDKCMHPHIIATDRELALMNACQQVFPGATRLLCRWHITENIRKRWRRRFKIDDEWKPFHIMWTVLVDSPTWIVYNDNYKTLQSMLRKYQGEYIPLESIDIFWTKLDISESISVANEDIRCEDDLEMIKEDFYQQSKAGKKTTTPKFFWSSDKQFSVLRLLKKMRPMSALLTPQKKNLMYKN